MNCMNFLAMHTTGLCSVAHDQSMPMALTGLGNMSAFHDRCGCQKLSTE